MKVDIMPCILAYLRCMMEGPKYIKLLAYFVLCQPKSYNPDSCVREGLNNFITLSKQNIITKYQTLGIGLSKQCTAVSLLISSLAIKSATLFASLEIFLNLTSHLLDEVLEYCEQE